MLGNINSETMRATNLQVIFDYIRRNEPASRRDIAEFGGLTVAAVSNITSKLLANGLVVEVGAGESVGGRRPTLLGINPGALYGFFDHPSHAVQNMLWTTVEWGLTGAFLNDLCFKIGDDQFDLFGGQIDPHCIATVRIDPQ